MTIAQQDDAQPIKARAASAIGRFWFGRAAYVRHGARGTAPSLRSTSRETPTRHRGHDCFGTAPAQRSRAGLLLRPDTQRADASSLCPLIVQKWQLRFPREHWIRIRHSNFIGTHLRGIPPPSEGHRPPPGRALLRVAGMGGAGSRLGRLAWVRHHPSRAAATGRPAPHIARPTNPPPPTEPSTPRRNRDSANRFRRDRITSPTQTSGTYISHFYTASGTPPDVPPPGESLGVGLAVQSINATAGTGDRRAVNARVQPARRSAVRSSLVAGRVHRAAAHDPTGCPHPQ